MVVTDGEHTRWMLLTLSRDTDGQGNPLDEVSPSASADDPGKAYSRFEDWLASMVELQGGAPHGRRWSTVDADDQLRQVRARRWCDVREAPVVEGYTTHRGPGGRGAA